MSTSEEYSTCRMCLAVGVRMRSISNTHLQDVYERITNIPLLSFDGASVMACYLCIHLLKKSKSFIEKSVRADEVLRQACYAGHEIAGKSFTMLEIARLHLSLGRTLPDVININPQGVPSEPTGPMELKTEVEVLAIKTEVDEEPEDGSLLIEVPTLRGDNSVDAPAQASDAERATEEESEISESERFPVVKKRKSTRNKKKSKFDLVPDNNDSSEHFNTFGKKQFKCSFCSEVFKYKTHLSVHLRSHTGIPAIDKVFIKEERLVDITPTVVTQTGRKQYHCNYCNKTFSTKCIVRHLRTHTGEKPFKCTSCNRAFSQKSNLLAHEKTHTGEKPFNCSHCEKAFIKKSDLTTHLRTHTGEKPFHCPHCSKPFSAKKYLTEHLRSHTGEKPFRCNHCSKSFSYQHSLYVHVKTHTGEKPFHCSYCSKTFSQKISLVQHLRIHTGEKPFHCSQYNETFRHRGPFVKHARSHISDRSQAVD